MDVSVWIRDAVVLPSGDRAMTVTSKGTITTWNLRTRKTVGRRNSLAEDVLHASFSASGRWLLVSTAPDRLVLDDLSRRNPKRTFQFAANTNSSVERIFPAAESGRFRIELYSGAAWFWDPDRDAPTPQSDDAMRFEARAVTPDGRYALAYDGTTVTLIDVAGNEKLTSYTADAGFASFALSHDGHIVALGDFDKRVHILILETPPARTVLREGTEDHE
jgi:WD40 repeat protein